MFEFMEWQHVVYNGEKKCECVLLAFSPIAKSVEERRGQKTTSILTGTEEAKKWIGLFAELGISTPNQLDTPDTPFIEGCVSVVDGVVSGKHKSPFG